MPRGGKRKGAGRPKGTGKYGVPTKAIRVPESMVDQITNYIFAKGFCYPLYSGRMTSEEVVPLELFDLNQYLVKNPVATFVSRATDNAMSGVGIASGDVLVVDRSTEPKNGDIVVALWKQEFLVRRLEKRERTVELKSENPAFATLDIPVESGLQVWGVVRFVLKGF